MSNKSNESNSVTPKGRCTIRPNDSSGGHRWESKTGPLKISLSLALTLVEPVNGRDNVRAGCHRNDSRGIQSHAEILSLRNQKRRDLIIPTGGTREGHHRLYRRGQGRSKRRCT